jgi:predicted transposase YbfD/YdcC
MNLIFVECFSELEDPRMERTKKHQLLAIIAIAICAVLAGAEAWEEIEDFGYSHEEWFRQFLELPNGIPSHDTINRVFKMLNTKAFQACSVQWLKQIAQWLPEQMVAIDGKTLRGSRRKQGCQKALHVVHAWSCVNGACLGQLKVDDKSNEIPAVPELLKLLYLKGAIVTLDAMGAQTETVQAICQAQADYVIALKGNQGLLHEAVQDSFTLHDQGYGQACLTAQDTPTQGRGRRETRRVDVLPAKLIRHQVEAHWEKLTSIVRLTSQRTVNHQTTTEQRYYITSLLPTQAEVILKAIRSHWQIENHLHWSLDTTFREDQSRMRDAVGAANFSWLRKLALALLKKGPSFRANKPKISIRRKQRCAASNLDYLTQIMAQI